MSAKEARTRAERYLNTADLLLGEGDYESCVSRAYYAMFYVVRELLRQRGIEPQTHSGTLNQFGLHVIKAGELPTRFGKMFGDAQESCGSLPSTSRRWSSPKTRPPRRCATPAPSWSAPAACSDPKPPA